METCLTLQNAIVWVMGQLAAMTRLGGACVCLVLLDLHVTGVWIVGSLCQDKAVKVVSLKRFYTHKTDIDNNMVFPILCYF